MEMEAASCGNSGSRLRFIRRVTRRMDTLNQVATARRSASVILLLDAATSSAIGPVAAASLAQAVMNLFSAADQFTNPHDERGSGFLSIPAIWRFWFVMKPLLERLDEPARAGAGASAHPA
jgi:hypothetical protein